MGIALLALLAMAMMSFYIHNYKVADAVTAVVKPNGNMGAQTVAFVPHDLPDWDEPDEEELIVEENPAPRPKKFTILPGCNWLPLKQKKNR
jgi:hypothetical protein